MTRRAGTAARRRSRRNRLSTAGAFEALPDHVAIVDEAGYIVAVNAAWRRFALGNGADAAKVSEGVNYLAACDQASGDDAPTARAFAEGVRGVLAGRIKHFRLEYPCHSPDEQRWFVGRVAPFLRGKVRRAVVTHHDITPRRQAELALEEREATFRAIVDEAAVGIVRTSIGGVILQVNGKLCTMLGYGREELVGDHIDRFLHPDEQDAVHARIEALLKGQATAYEREGRYRRKDGALLWAATSVALVCSADGTPKFLTAMMSDITARRQAEEELQRLLRIAQQSSDSIVVTDVDGTIVFVNEACVAGTGYRRDELIGANPRLLQSGRTPASTYASMWRSLSAGEAWEGELVNRRRDGAEYIENARISPVRQADGRISNYVAVKRDITESRRLQEELQRHREHLEELVIARTAQLDDARTQAEAANEAKSAFLANMSHEIRTPMNGVLGMLEILEHTPLTAAQANMVCTIRRSGTALLALIDGILDLSKIEAGRMHVEPAPVAPGGLVYDVCAVLGPAAQREGVEVEPEVAPDVPVTVVTDGLRLRQILLNLLGNAIKFSGGRAARRGRVRVRVTVASDPPLALTFEVADNGIGMSEAAAASLFAPFTQLESSTTRRYGGTGLGLAICKRLTELLGGSIRVTSRLGEGSVFAVTLPAARIEPGGADARPRLAVAPAAPQPAARPATDAPILVAEDDEVNREVIRRQLQLFGLRVEIAHNGREALDAWRTGRYSLLLTDLHMPEIDGYALAAAIREDEATHGKPRQPLVALTANALRGEAERARSLGFDDYLTKPLQLEQLSQVLARWQLLHPSPGGTMNAFARARGNEAAVLDLAVLRGLVGSDTATVREFLGLFLRTTGPFCAELVRAAATHDAEAVANITHKLKSSARSIGAIGLGALCAELETAGRALDLDTVSARLPGFLAEFERVEKEISEVLLARGPGNEA